MLHARRFVLKWISILIAYICIFLLSYEFGASRRTTDLQRVTTEPHLLKIKRIVYDNKEYLNSSVILQMIQQEFKYSLPFKIDHNKTSMIRHALVVFYDYSYHHMLFQQFLWLYSSWVQLPRHAYIKNDLILFISSPTIPNDFQKLENITKHENQLIIYSCLTLVDSILNKNNNLLNEFSLNFRMELVRLFYWQQRGLSSLLLFLDIECQQKLRNYDYIFRLDVDSFLLPNFHRYQQTSPFVLGETIPYDKYTLNRLERIKNYFSSISKIRKQSLTISWFGRLDFLSKLSHQIILMAVWLMKEEFTESERLHHLTYLNYPSWYVDGIFEYATAIILSLHQFDQFYQKTVYRFDCHHIRKNCLHISFRDPTHHLHLSKHSLQLLTHINQSNLTADELYIFRTVIKSNGLFRLHFSYIN